ncbi:MAG: hypothetical protein WCG28_00610 [bacterium]
MTPHIKNNFFPTLNGVWFKGTDIKKIRMMEGCKPLYIISTVCPDYSNDGQKYTFSGNLGSGISLTAQEHLTHVPEVLEVLSSHGFRPKWTILVADLPEVVESQSDFLTKVALGREDYLSRCALSAVAIKQKVSDLAQVLTFSGFYGNHSLDYLMIQNQVAKRVREEGEVAPFRSKFHSFAFGRAELAQKFRGRRLSEEEIMDAGAHGMSLYITHGTLLRQIFLGKNLVVVNHETPNLQNFYLCNFVSGYEHLLNTPKFPLGILKKDLY